MATLKRRLHKNNGSGYDIVYFETLAELVKCNDGTTVESALSGKASVNHMHSANFSPYELNTANFCEGFNYSTGELWFNYHGASSPITTYSLGNGMGERLGYMIHTGNIAEHIANCTSGNSNAVGGYGVGSLWRSDGAVWNPNANVICSGTNTEYSFDINETGDGDSIVHMWSSNLGRSIMQWWAKSGKTIACHNGDVGQSQVCNTVASTNDPGTGFSLESGTVFLVYE